MAPASHNYAKRVNHRVETCKRVLLIGHSAVTCAAVLADWAVFRTAFGRCLNYYSFTSAVASTWPIANVTTWRSYRCFHQRRILFTRFSRFLKTFRSSLVPALLNGKKQRPDPKQFQRSLLCSWSRVDTPRIMSIHPATDCPSMTTNKPRWLKRTS